MNELPPPPTDGLPRHVHEWRSAGVVTGVKLGPDNVWRNGLQLYCIRCGEVKLTLIPREVST